MNTFVAAMDGSLSSEPDDQSAGAKCPSEGSPCYDAFFAFAGWASPSSCCRAYRHDARGAILNIYEQKHFDNCTSNFNQFSNSSCP